MSWRHRSALVRNLNRRSPMRFSPFVRRVALGLAALHVVVPAARAQTTEYVYETRNRLVEVRRGDSVLARFHWDAEGRLRRKIGQLGIRDYVYDGRRLVAEYDENGRQVAKYNWTGDRVVSVERADEVRRSDGRVRLPGADPHRRHRRRVGHHSPGSHPG